jgi:hypothetical protein
MILIGKVGDRPTFLSLNGEIASVFSEMRSHKIEKSIHRSEPYAS